MLSARALDTKRFWYNNVRPFQSTCTPRSPFIYPFTCLSKVLLPVFNCSQRIHLQFPLWRARAPFARGKGGFSIKRSVTPAQCRCVGYCTQRALGTHPDRSEPAGKGDRKRVKERGGRGVGGEVSKRGRGLNRSEALDILNFHLDQDHWSFDHCREPRADPNAFDDQRGTKAATVANGGRARLISNEISRDRV